MSTEFIKTFFLQLMSQLFCISLQSLQVQKTALYNLRILKQFRKSGKIHQMFLLQLFYKINCEEKQIFIILTFELKDYN